MLLFFLKTKILTKKVEPVRLTTSQDDIKNNDNIWEKCLETGNKNLENQKSFMKGYFEKLL